MDHQMSLINYVRERQMSLAVNTSYSSHTTRVNQGFMLLKLISLDTLSMF